MGKIGNTIVPSAEAAEIPQTQNDVMDVRMPDGTLVKNVPSNVTQSQLQEKLTKFTATAQPQDNSKYQRDMLPNVAGQFAQGATFGLGDEAIAGLASARSAFDKGSLSDVSKDYDEALNVERGSEKQFQKEHPWISIGSQLAGGLATGVAGGQTAAGKAIASQLGEGGLMARVAKNATAGAASGGLYGFGSGEGDSRLSSAGKGALFGGAVGGAIPLAGAAYNSLKGGAADIATGVGARNSEELSQSIDEAHQAASPFYQKMRGMGDTLNESASQKVISNIKSALSDPENEYIPELSAKTTTIIKALTDKAENGSIGVSTLDQYMRKLQRVVGDPEDTFSAGVAKKAIWDTLKNLSGEDLASGSTKAVELLDQARQTSAKAFRFEEVANILQKANGDPNKIKAALSRFVSNDANLAPFNDAEKSALREAANTSAGGNILKAFGKLGFDFSKSGTGNTVLPALGMLAKGAAEGTAAYAFPHIGIPAVMGATLARQGQKYLARGQAENVLKLIMERGARATPEAASSISPFTLGAVNDAGQSPSIMQRMRK